jgi:hypothetical protein
MLPIPRHHFIFAIALMASAHIARAGEFWVAPTGNDANSGTKDQPFATLARAQQAVRQAKGGTVIVRGGTYYLPETLVFTAADCGTEYRAAEGETVVVSGGMKLDLKWGPYRDGIMQAKTPEGLAIDQLFVNGRRQIMARYPNYDPNVLPYGGYAADAFSRERAARWSDPAGGYIHAMHRAHWGGYHYRITGKNEKGDVTYEGGWQNNRPMGMHPQHRYVENIFEELDAPGEWFHNAKTATLYYKPAEGVDLAKATVEVVRLRHLIEFQGTQQKPVRHVTLRGFILRHAARTFMDTKEPLLRSDWTIYRGGAVFFNGAEDCVVADCEFDQMGGNAVFVNNYNRRVTIRGCDVHDTGASAVAFVGDPKAVRNPLFDCGQRLSYDQIDKTPGPKTDNYPADCLVEDCLIRNVGVVEKQATGVEISMAMGITIRHCSIYEASRAGINISEGTFGGHVIEFCDVFDTVRETGDHGSFNSWGRDRYWGLQNVPAGEMPDLALLDVVKLNVIRNSRWRCDHGWDVDLDDGSSNYEIYNNLFLRGGLKLREGFHRRVWNNIAVNNSLHPHVWYENSRDVVTNNIWMGAYRPAAMSARLKKWGREVDRNLFTTSEADRKKFANKGCDANSLVGDPLFVDPVNGDFLVKDGSPALKLGFKNFPMDQFGVRKPVLKAIARTPEIPELRLKTESAAAEPRVAWKGATIKDLSGEEFSAVGVARDAAGVWVTVVPAGSEAAKLGLRGNDFIQAVNGKPVKNVSEFLKAFGALPPGLKAKLDVFRNQQRVTLEVTVESANSASSQDGAAASATPDAASSQPPIFQYRVLANSFRKSPANTPERVAADLKQIVPDDIKPWAVISLVLSAAGYNYLDGDTPLEFAKRFDRQGYRFMIEIADPGIPDPPNRRIFLRPDQIRAIFAACPNCIGVETGETFWAFTGGDNAKIDQWLMEVLAACAENRRYFILGEGTWNKGHWTRFFFRHYAALRANHLGQWLVPMHKNTKPWATLQNVSALQGAWMTGLVENYGLWNDEWTWTYSSFGHANELPPYNKADQNMRKIPYTYFLRQWLWTISQGATFSSTENALAFSREGKANSTFAKYLYPFIKGIGEHRITPSKEAVMRKTKAIADPFGTYTTAKGPWTYDPLTVFFTYLDEPTAFAPKSYDPFTVLFRNTYGFSAEYDGTSAAGRMFPREPSLPDRLTRETLPNTARYYCLPILPHPSAQAPRAMKTVKLADVHSDAAVKRTFDTLYPVDPYGTAVHAVEVDDSIFVLNGNENRDVDQYFKLRLGEGVLKSMEGNLPFQNLIFGKREGRDRYWFQTNGYHGDGITPGQRYLCPPKPTVITFTCTYRQARNRLTQPDRGVITIFLSILPQPQTPHPAQSPGGYILSQNRFIYFVTVFQRPDNPLSVRV